MLVIECADHLINARAFAEAYDVRVALETMLADLASHGAKDADDETVRCRLMAGVESARPTGPGFVFQMERRLAYGGWKPWFQGRVDYSAGLPESAATRGAGGWIIRT
jgi:hypothetical protein